MLRSSSGIGHPAGARADAEPRRRPVPCAAPVRAVPGDCAAVLPRALPRARRVSGDPAARRAPAVRRRSRRRRRGARLGARRPRRGHVAWDRRRPPVHGLVQRAPQRRVHLHRLLGHAAGESSGRRHVGRRPGGGALVRRLGVVGRVLPPLRLRGRHPALQPVEAQAGLLVLLPMPLPLLTHAKKNIVRSNQK
jgi:hypothetical protein